MSLSVSRGVTEVSLGLLSWSALLVCSLGPLCAVTAVLQRSSLGSLCLVAACGSTILSWSSLGPFYVVEAVISEFLKFVGDRRVWKQSGTCSLKDLINRLGVLENPTCKKLACWLAREAESGGEGTEFTSPPLWYGGPREWCASLGG